jgi:hypothetical protein
MRPVCLRLRGGSTRRVFFVIWGMLLVGGFLDLRCSHAMAFIALCCDANLALVAVKLRSLRALNEYLLAFSSCLSMLSMLLFIL